MAYSSIGATTYLCPVPVVLVGCAASDGQSNLITVAWTGICCTKPPMLSISIRPDRYSYHMIEETGEFTVNFVSQSMCRQVDFCGVRSGRELDKFAATGLTAIPAQGLSLAPAVAQSPAYLSCRVSQKLELGSHTLFLAEIAHVNVDNQYFSDTGAIEEERMKLVAYAHGHYYPLGRPMGFFGSSVAGEKALKRRK